jgi:hypothetical protein
LWVLAGILGVDFASLRGAANILVFNAKLTIALKLIGCDWLRCLVVVWEN